jgi:hydrogenase-1 operon protein HyaF
MSRLEDIAVEVIHDAGAGHTGQLLAILSELHNLLVSLQRKGEAGSIDLRSLPMFPGDYEKLKALLGVGEVTATINTLGKSLVEETSIPGIWWITHYNTEEETIAEFIEVTELPDLLKTQKEDLSIADTRLNELITNLTAEDHG